MADAKTTAAKTAFKRPEQPTPSAVSPEAERFVHGTSPASAESPRESNVEEKTTDQVAKAPVTEDKKPKAPKLKRLTIDIPDDLHRRLKSHCAAQGTTIAVLVRGYLERKFPDPKSQQE
jgi:hypothetical protein